MILEIALVVTAFLTSLLSGVLGLGGGTILAALMFSVLPPAQALPLHAVVQIFSNGARTIANFKDVAFDLLGLFLLAAIPATFLVVPLVIRADPNAVRLVMGAFLLATYDGRWIQRLGLAGPAGLLVAGGIAGGLGSVVGATGAMMAPFFFRPGWSRQTIVGTQAVCQGVAHVIKVGAFAALGVALLNDVPLAVAMTLAVIAGTFTGKRLLDKLDDRIFRKLYTVIVFVLGVQLIVRAAL